MKLEESLLNRSGNKCELCEGTTSLQVYEVKFGPGKSENNSIIVCAECLAQIEKKRELVSSHWQGLTKSMWSEVPAVQIVAWRMLNRLRNESWAMESLDMMYLDEEMLEWAKA